MASSVTKNYIPQIDYVSRDYTAILADLTAIAKQFNPTWAVSDPSDIGVALLETFAYMGDILSFYTDRMASEGFLGTASQRASVLQIAAMFGYTITPSSAAVVTLTFTNGDTSNSVTIAAGTQVASTTTVNGQSTQVVFETDSAVTIAANGTGSVTATQGITTSLEAVGTSNGTPSQSFKLSQTGVIINSTGSNIKVYVGGIQYNYTSSLVDNSPYDSVFTTAMDADGYTYVVFGDGVGGRIPPATYSVTVTYRVGVGSQGNVAAGSIQGSTLTGNYNVTVSQPSAASGGADDESTDSIRYNVPRALRTLRRAVSLKDYAYLALQVSGVSKASADSSVWSNVNLYIAPFGSSAVNNYSFTGSSITAVTQTATDGTSGTEGLTYTAAAGTFTSIYGLTANSLYVTVSGLAPADYNITVPVLITNVKSDGSAFTVATSYSTFPTYVPSLSSNAAVSVTGPATAAFTTLKSSVINYFTDKVAPNVTLNVVPPTYVPVNLEMTLHVLPQYSQANVTTQVQNALSNLVSYNNSFFADRIPPHFILNSITNIDGVDYATVEHLRRASNEQLYSIATWTRPTTTTATLTFSNNHTITAGQNIRVYNSGGVDGTYVVNSVTSTSVTITTTAATATPTSVNVTSYGIGQKTVLASSIAGITVGMQITATNISSPAIVTSISGSTIGISTYTTAVTNPTTAAATFALLPTDASNTVKVFGVDSSTSAGVSTYGIVCGANEIPSKGTFIITATGGLT
jgi:hypothetical protein